MVRRGSASKCDIWLAAKTLFIFSTIRQDSCHISLFRLFGGDFANVFELTNRKEKNGSWRKSPSGSNDCALREQSPLRVRIQFPPAASHQNRRWSESLFS